MVRVPKALATAKKPRFLIVNRKTEEVVHVVSYKGKSTRQQQRIYQGLLSQIDTKKFRIKDDP